jgi:hypothetical protein
MAGAIREAQNDADQTRALVVEENEMLRSMLEETRDMMKQKELRKVDAGMNTDEDDAMRQKMDTEKRLVEELASVHMSCQQLGDEIDGLKEDLENKVDVIRSLEAVIAQAATKESARAGGAAASIAKQVCVRVYV